MGALYLDSSTYVLVIYGLLICSSSCYYNIDVGIGGGIYGLCLSGSSGLTVLLLGVGGHRDVCLVGGRMIFLSFVGIRKMKRKMTLVEEK